MHISTGLLRGAISDLEVHLLNQGWLEKRTWAYDSCLHSYKKPFPKFDSLDIMSGMQIKE